MARTSTDRFARTQLCTAVEYSNHGTRIRFGRTLLPPGLVAADCSHRHRRENHLHLGPPTEAGQFGVGNTWCRTVRRGILDSVGEYGRSTCTRFVHLLVRRQSWRAAEGLDGRSGRWLARHWLHQRADPQSGCDQPHPEITHLVGNRG